MATEFDPFMKEATLHYAQTATADFIKGLEIGQKAFADCSIYEETEARARDKAHQECIATEGSLHALFMGTSAAIDEIVTRQEVEA